jgi:uroporphyrinogen-III synthase
LLAFTPVPFELPPPTDWIFFYSSRAVTFFLAGYPGQPPAEVRLATIGPGTAATLAEHWRPADFVGSGHPLAVAEAFAARLAAGTTVLFPRARRSRQSVQTRLPARIKSVDLIVYDNAIATQLTVPVTDVAVLTSPLNAEAYLAAVSRPAERLVAIGSSTARWLASQGRACHTAAAPDEATLAATILGDPPDHG